MKRWMTLCCIAALFVVASCRENREKDIPVDGMRTLVFQAGMPDVKTAFGESTGGVRPTLWTANDAKVKVSLNCADAVEAGVVPASDHRSASFSVEMDPSAATSPFTFYAVSPASAATAMSPSRGAWRIKIPSVQTPVEGSVDEAAQILAARSTAFTEIPSMIPLHFSHATAYGLLSLKNLSLGGATVRAVELTCTTPIVGEFYYKCDDGTFTASGESSTLRVVTSQTDAVWFACAPVDVGGEILVVSVITDQGTLTKEVAFPAGRKFASGKIATFGVDMAGVEFGTDGYSLVTAVSSLSSGDKVLILSADERYVMSTTQNKNNRSAIAIPSGKMVNHSIKEADLPTDTQVLTLGAGKTSGTWSFSTGSGYLANTNSTSSNQLKTVESITDNASFTVSIATSGVATVKASTGDRNWMRFNLNSAQSNPIFACYSSGQDDICIFRKGGSGSGASADNPLLAETRFGVYLSDDSRVYTEGEDQYSREYNGGVLTFAILHPSDNEQIEITGYRKSLVKGDAVTVTFLHRKGLTVIKEDTYNLQVLGEDGSKVWLGDGSGKGFIIKK